MSKNLTQLLSGTAGITACLLFTAPQAIAQSANFRDVQGYWAEPYVTNLATRKIIGGFPDGTFKPNADITRAQFAAIAVKALNLPANSSSRAFVDVPSGYWAANAIATVSNSGLVTGFPDGTFRPEDRITRAQALVVLAKALRNANSNSTALNNYVDRQAVPEWALESLAKAANARIIVNYPEPNRIEPNDLATRGEVAALMYQTLSRLGNTDLPSLTIGLIGGTSGGVSNGNNSSSGSSNLTIERVGLNNDSRRIVTGGDELTIRATGTARANGSFTIEGVAKDLPLSEVQSGIYEGRYTVRRQDGQANARIVATLSASGTTPVSKAAERTITIDGAPPEIRELQPANQTRVSNRQTDISAVLSDGKGIGIDQRSIRLIVNGVDVTSQSTINQNFVNYRPTQPLVGNAVRVELRVADQAGNQTNRSWAFGFGNSNTGTGTGTGSNNSGTQLTPQITNFSNNDAIALPDRLQGQTLANARVQVRVEAYTSIAGVVGVAQPLFNNVVQADNNGRFTVTVQPAGFNLVSGTRYRVFLRAIDPQTNRIEANELFLVQK